MPNIVAVTFNDRTGYRGTSPQSKKYHYLTDLNLQVGDTCVVDAPSGTTLVTVTDLNPVDGVRHASKWIVTKVDRSRYEARQQAVQELGDLHIKLNIALEKAIVLEQRRRIAERYPYVAALIRQVEGLEATLGSFGS